MGSYLIEVKRPTGVFFHCNNCGSEMPIYLFLEKHDWPDCHEIQCRQAHDLANQILMALKEPCEDCIYIIGKAVRIHQAIDKLQKQNDDRGPG